MVPVAKVVGLSGLAIVAGLLLSAGRITQAQSGNPASTGQPTPTFTKHVLPILQRSCQQCHRPGTHGPYVIDDLPGGPAVGATQSGRK